MMRNVADGGFDVSITMMHDVPIPLLFCKFCVRSVCYVAATCTKVFVRRIFQATRVSMRPLLVLL